MSRSHINLERRVFFSSIMELFGAFIFGFIVGTFLFIIGGYLEKEIQALPEIEEETRPHID